MGNQKIKTIPYPQSKLNYENLKEQPKKMAQSYNFCYIPSKFQSLVMLRNCNQIVINIYDIPTYLWLTPSNQHLNSLKSKLQKECQVRITCFSTFNDLKQYLKQENKKHSIQYNLICSTNQLKNVIKYYGNSEMIKQIICFSKDIEIYWEIKKSSKSMSKFVFGTNQVEELIQFIQMNRHKQYSFKQLPNFISLKSEIWLSNIQILSIYAMLVQQINRQQMVQHFCKFAHWIAPNYYHDIQEFKKEAMQDQLSPERAIHWYSKQSFVFKVINSTLRSSKSPFQLFYLQSFCKDLIIGIKHFHKIQKKIKKYQSFKCYRGGYVSKLQIDKLKQSIGGIVQNMGFLSTSLNKKVAECFVTNVIFEISVTDKQRDEKIEAGFAHIQDLSFMQDQQQVLFNPLNYFHVQSIVEKQVKQVQSKVSKQKIVYEIKMVYGSIPEMMSKRKNNKSSLSQEQKKYLALMDFQLQKLEGATTQGRIFFQDCFIEGCCQYWEKALELCQYENVSNLQRNIIRNVCLEHLAECYSRFDRYAQALNVLEEARKIAFKVFGPKDIDYYRTILQIADVLSQSGKKEKAIKIAKFCYRKSFYLQKGTSKKEKQQFRQQVLSKLFEIYKSKQNYRVCQRILKNKDIKDLKECDIFQNIKQKRKVCNSNQKRKMHIKQLEKQRDQIIEKQGKNHKRYLDVMLNLWIQQCIKKQFIKADSNLRQLVENSRLYHGRHNINHAKNIGYVSYLMSLFWYNNISIMQMCKQAEDIVAIYGGQHPQSLGILTNCSKAYLKRKMYKQSMRIEQLLFRNKLKTQVSPNIAETSTN